MKKIFYKSIIIAFITFVFANNSFAQYSNATLNGPWFMHTVPYYPYNDSLNYLVFNGNGGIIDGNMFPAPVSGTYNVTSSGFITGLLIIESDTIPIGGQLISQNEVNMGSWNMSRIMNPGALTDTIIGLLQTNAYGQQNVMFKLNSQGQIISSSGLTPPVTGRIYSQSGVFIGHIKTGETTHWHEFSIYGYYSNDSLNGEVSVDADSTGTGRYGPAKLLRKGIATPTFISTNSTQFKDIIIYPNPANNFISIRSISKINKYFTINIYNLKGELIQSKKQKQYQTQLSIEELKNGIYLLEIITNEGIEKQRLIIQR